MTLNAHLLIRFNSIRFLPYTNKYTDTITVSILISVLCLLSYLLYVLALVLVLVLVSRLSLVMFHDGENWKMNGLFDGSQDLRPFCPCANLRARQISDSDLLGGKTNESLGMAWDGGLC